MSSPCSKRADLRQPRIWASGSLSQGFHGLQFRNQDALHQQVGQVVEDERAISVIDLDSLLGAPACDRLCALISRFASRSGFITSTAGGSAPKAGCKPALRERRSAGL